jgi:hypothetical protein
LAGSSNRSPLKLFQARLTEPRSRLSRLVSSVAACSAQWRHPVRKSDRIRWPPLSHLSPGRDRAEGEGEMSLPTEQPLRRLRPILPANEGESESAPSRGVRFRDGAKSRAHAQAEEWTLAGVQLCQRFGRLSGETEAKFDRLFCIHTCRQIVTSAISTTIATAASLSHRKIGNSQRIANLMSSESWLQLPSKLRLVATLPALFGSVSIEPCSRRRPRDVSASTKGC